MAATKRRTPAVKIKNGVRPRSLRAPRGRRSNQAIAANKSSETTQKIPGLSRQAVIGLHHHLRHFPFQLLTSKAREIIQLYIGKYRTLEPFNKAYSLYNKPRSLLDSQRIERSTSLIKTLILAATFAVAGCFWNLGCTVAAFPSGDFAGQSGRDQALPDALLLVLPQVKAKTTLPVLLPSALPKPFSDAKHAIVEKAGTHE